MFTGLTPKVRREGDSNPRNATDTERREIPKDYQPCPTMRVYVLHIE